MPRSGVVGTYTLPPGTDTQAPNTTISSSMFNGAMDDIEQTFNTATPIAYGGTGASTQAGAQTALDVPSNANAIRRDVDQSAQSESSARKTNIVRNTLQAWEQIGAEVVVGSPVANVQWLNLGVYKRLRLSGLVKTVSDNTNLSLFVGSGGVPDTAASYSYNVLFSQDATVAGATVYNTTISPITTSIGSAFEGILDLRIENFNVASATRILSNTTTVNSSGAYFNAQYGLRHNPSVALDCIRLVLGVGNIAAGSSFILEGQRG